MIQVELGSVTEVDRFRDLLKNTSGFDISIKLTWKATPKELKKGFSDFPKMDALVLEVDGIATDIHHQDKNHVFIDFYASYCSDESDFGILAFLNYPSPQEHCLRIGNFNLRLKSPPKRPFYSWEEFRSSLIEFSNIVSTTHLSSECEAASRELQLAIEENGLPEVAAIVIHDDSWFGVFDLEAGAFVKVYSFDMTLPEIVVSTGSVNKLILPLSVTENDHDLYRFVQAANRMQELCISNEGGDVLSHIDFIGRLRRPGIILFNSLWLISRTIYVVDMLPK